MPKLAKAKGVTEQKELSTEEIESCMSTLMVAAVMKWGFDLYMHSTYTRVYMVHRFVHF